MDNEERNRDRDQRLQGSTRPEPREGTTGEDQIPRPMADRDSGVGAGPERRTPSDSTDEDLQREGNLGNERNRNQPDQGEEA